MAVTTLEAELASTWEGRRYAPDLLVADDGSRLQVIFPGRRWGGPGPDFKGALLALPDGRLLRGDVEVHRRSSDWARHGHTRDAAYRGVVLHVVQVIDAPTVDSGGRSVPTVALHPTAETPVEPWAAPCLQDPDRVLRVVEDAGRERFRAHVARFEGDLSAMSADQVLWRGVAEALGYSRNTRPFGALADAVSYAEAAHFARDRGEASLAALLLGTAGLAADGSREEQACWVALQEERGARAWVAPSSWDCALLRPLNHPVARCRGLAALAARWAAASPAQLVLQEGERAVQAARPVLWSLVRVRPWIGLGRAQAIVVNVLVPFAAASGVAGAAELFERLPGEPANRIVTYMATRLGGSRQHFRSACQQQGLLALFKNACAGRVCECCTAAARPLALG